MLLHTCEGPRSIDLRDIEHLSIEERFGRYTQATMTLSGNREVSGLMLAEALGKIEERLVSGCRGASWPGLLTRLRQSR